MSEDLTPEQKNELFVKAVSQAIVELAFFEGYFEQLSHTEESYSDQRDRAARARQNLQAAWLDVLLGGE